MSTAGLAGAFRVRGTLDHCSFHKVFTPPWGIPLLQSPVHLAEVGQFRVMFCRRHHRAAPTTY
jgi:hypothetical protein